MELDTVLPLLASDPTASFDLAELAFSIARDEYPNLDIEGELAELSGMAQELRPRLHGDLNARVRMLSRYLFHELGFEGNLRDYYDPRNSYLNEVLTRRVGLPLSLSLVAMIVGCRAGLEVLGVGLPGHFITKAVLGDQTVYFDPFHGGRVLTVADCGALVEQVLGSPYHPTHEALEAVPAGYIALRILTNLKAAYLRVRDFTRSARVIRRMQQLCPGDGSQRRDLGAVLLQGGRPGPAIDHLEAYLATEPPPEDSRSVRELLVQAPEEVARWN